MLFIADTKYETEVFVFVRYIRRIWDRGSVILGNLLCDGI